MKNPHIFSRSFCITLICLGLLSPESTEATIKYLINYCGSDIDLGSDDLGGFVLRSQLTAYYRNNEDCSVRIIASNPENYVLLHFTAFSLEGDDFCIYDKLQIYSNGEQLTPTYGLCDAYFLPSDYLANNLELHFETDFSVTDVGFEIVVTEVSRDDECGNDYYLCDNGHCINQNLGEEYGLEVSDYCGNDFFVIDENYNENSHENSDENSLVETTEENYEDEEIDWTVAVIIGSSIGGILFIAIIAGIVCCVYSCATAKPLAVTPLSTVSTVSTTVPYPRQPPPPGTFEMEPVHMQHFRQPGIHGVQLPPISGYPQHSNSVNQTFFASDFTVARNEPVLEAFSYRPPPFAPR